MRLLSVIPGDIRVRVKAPRPHCQGELEIQLPARAVQLLYGQAMTLPDDEAAVVIAVRGVAGVIQVPDDTPDDPPVALLTEARRLRMTHLRKLLDSYRIEQGMRQASGRELLPPSEGIRQALRESKELMSKISEDPETKELQAGLPQGDRLREMSAAAADAVVSELAEYGIDPKAGALQPGVTAWEGSLPTL